MIAPFILAHETEILLVSLYCGLAAVSCLPKPGDPRPVGDKAYEAFYDFLHLMSNKVAERNPKLASFTVTPGTTVVTPTTVTSNDPKV